MDDFIRAQIAAQRVVRRSGIEQQNVASAHRSGQGRECFRRRIDNEEMDVARCHGLLHGRRDLGGGLHRDPLQREIRFQDAGQHLRIVETDLGAGEGVLADLQDQALVGLDRLVADIALDFDISDRQPLPRRLRILGLRQRPTDKSEQAEAGQQPHRMPAPSHRRPHPRAPGRPEWR